MRTTSHFFSKGFTLLYAVMVMGALLSVVYAIVDITFKQVQLSSLAKDSQVAFYVADAGAECAQYWDNQGAFDKVTNGSQRAIKCYGQTKMVGSAIESACRLNPAESCVTTLFTLNFDDQPGKPDVVVTVEKNVATRRSLVESKGHNTDNQLSSRRVERAVQLMYTPRQRFCNIDADVMVALDVSDSILSVTTEYNNAATTLVNNLFNASAGMRVGLVKFAGNVLFTDDMRFHTSNEKNDLINKINQNDTLGSGTNIPAAIRAVNYGFTNKKADNIVNDISENGSYTGTRTDRPDKKNVLVIITDGQATKTYGATGYNSVAPGAQQAQDQVATESDTLKGVGTPEGTSIYVIQFGAANTGLNCTWGTNNSCSNFIQKAVAGGPDHRSTDGTNADSGTPGTEKYVYQVSDTGTNFASEINQAVEALTKCN